MPVGRYRELTDAEIKSLNQLIEPSSKTEEASLPKVARNLERPTAKAEFPEKDAEKTGKPEKKSFKTEKPLRKEPQGERSKPEKERRDFGPKQQPATRKIEIIKKDDPRYRKKGDY